MIRVAINNSLPLEKAIVDFVKSSQGDNLRVH